LCSLDSALLDTIKIFIGSLEKVSNLMAKTWYSDRGFGRGCGRGTWTMTRL
jgi:hypothetical protein